MPLLRQNRHSQNSTARMTAPAHVPLSRRYTYAGSDVDVQRVYVAGRDAYHITFTANGKPYSFYVDTHDGDIF